MTATLKIRVKHRIKSFLIDHDLWDEPVAHEPEPLAAAPEEEDWREQVDAAIQHLDENVDIDKLIAELDEEPEPAPELDEEPEPAPEPESEPELENEPQADPESADGGLTLENVQQVLDDMVRPALQMDGGDLSLVKVENNDVYVRLVGACHSCPSSVMTMKMGIERLLHEEFPDMGSLIQVDNPFDEAEF